jgi:hypothetical protein
LTPCLRPSWTKFWRSCCRFLRLEVAIESDIGV